MDRKYQFKGRGRDTCNAPCRHIECASGTVIEVTYRCHGVDFVLAYCRRAIIDRWGVQCLDAFRRASDAGYRRSWAVPIKGDLLLFRPTKFEIMCAQDWMGRTR